MGTITISKADFLNGAPQDRCGCALALALMRLPEIRCAHVFEKHAFLEFTDGSSRAVSLSKQAQRVVAKFDKITLSEQTRVDPRAKFEAVTVDFDMTPIDCDPFSAAVASAAPATHQALPPFPEVAPPKSKPAPEAPALAELTLF